MTKQDIINHIAESRSFLCVGLDPDLDKMPRHLAGKGAEGILEFNRAIIDATAPYCVAYKPNLAFYEVLGAAGVEAFEKTCEYIKEKYPRHFLIADAKRGDIGNTSRMYAKAMFELSGVDAVTVAPYMGNDSVTPFLSYDGKWVILLALTSNKGSLDFQLTTDGAGERLFEKVIKTSQQWGDDNNLMYVVGATRGEMFKDIRAVAPDYFLLVPGVGAQGGSLDEVSKYGMTADCGLLVNSSRGILYASNGDDFAEAAAAEARKLRDEMDILLKRDSRL